MMPYPDHKAVRVPPDLAGGLGNGCANEFSRPSASLFRRVYAGAPPVTPSGRQLVRPGKQRGVVLFIALIALVALTLAGIALMRSVDTGNVIAGNLAFQQAALQASDIGTETALAALPNIIATSLDAVCQGPACPANPMGLYYPTMRTVDANGVPTTGEAPTLGSAINWSTLPTTTVSGYGIQYVIDRLCQGPAPVNNVQANCSMGVPLGGGSHKAGAIVFSAAGVVYYRVTVRVTGPRNAVSMVQTMLSD
jgi:Tfp pilus assembly protein PilX